MFEKLKKKQHVSETEKKDGNGILVIRERDPQVCGGTNTTLDTRAPKEISSHDMTIFDVTSALNAQGGKNPEGEESLRYVSAFAVPAGTGSFLFLETRTGQRKREGETKSAALLTENVFPGLCRLVRDCRLAERNGYQSHTYGLPENFGGSIDIKYGSGERISCSNNQSPVLSYEAGTRIASFFEKALQGRKQEIPPVSLLSAIRFSEKRTGGGYTKAHLTLNPDGTGTNHKESKYDVAVYESASEIDAATMKKIMDEIERSALFAWEKLPASGLRYGADEEMTFEFKDGREITVRKDRALPDQISRGFFNIQLEMTTKH